MHSLNPIVSALLVSASATASFARTPSDYAFEYSIYALGFVGLFAITLIPLRSWQILRANYSFLRATSIGTAVFGILLLIAAAAIAAEASLVAHIFRCLIGLHCGANRASGWFSATGIGFWYLCFELACFLILFACRRTLPRPTDS